MARPMLPAPVMSVRIVVWSLSAGGTVVPGSGQMKKPQSPRSASAALGAGPAAPSRSSRTKPSRPVPPGRAASACASEDAVVTSRSECDGKPSHPSSANWWRCRDCTRMARARTGVRVPGHQAACALVSHQASKAVSVGAMGSGSVALSSPSASRVLRPLPVMTSTTSSPGRTAPSAMARSQGRQGHAAGRLGKDALRLGEQADAFHGGVVGHGQDAPHRSRGPA